MLTRETLRLIAIVVLTLAHFNGAGRTRADDISKSKSEEFHWRNNGDDGIVLTRLVRGSEFAGGKIPDNIKTTIRLSENLDEFWEIKAVTAFRQTPGDRVKLTYQGPYPWRANDAKPNSRVQHWVLYDLLDETYEIELYLRRKKNGMPTSQVRSAVEQRNELTFRADPL